MRARLKKEYLRAGPFSVASLTFIPEQTIGLGVFTHGYTSHKADLLNWGTKLAEINIASVIFDLPGHYLADFKEVERFEDFCEYAHQIFDQALLFGLEKTEYLGTNLAFGGHSLGGLLALKSIQESKFNIDFGIGVGLGLLDPGQTHLFQTNFYQETIALRSQLVSPEIAPETMFKWIHQEKLGLTTRGKTVHLISGVDDLVVGHNGMENLKAVLEKNNNTVTIDRPRKLPHHQPELAGTYVKKYLLQNFSF